MQISNRDPERWRYDAAGNIVLKALKDCKGILCYKYTPIIPFSKGGEISLDNCHVLQSNSAPSSQNNLLESASLLQAASHKLKLSEIEMDFIEEAVYGNVSRMIL